MLAAPSQHRIQEHGSSGKVYPQNVRPGHGYPGRLEVCEITPDLQMKMDRFDLTAGWFRRAPINPETYRYEPHRCPVNELPYLLYTPKRGRKPVPMVLYFGGTGEHGTNLVDQFRQTTIFAKLTDPKFQDRHPCYLFAPMLPKDGVIRSGQTGSPSNLSDLVCDAMYAAGGFRAGLSPSIPHIRPLPPLAVPEPLPSLPVFPFS